MVASGIEAVAESGLADLVDGTIPPEGGWEPWISEANVDREVWVRPTTTVMAEVAEVPEVEVTEGGPDD